MCGRFTRTKTIQEYAEYYDAESIDEIETDYNITPSDSILVVVAEADQSRHFTWLHWGLVPFWSKGPDKKFSMINARQESLQQKPAYRTPYKRHRCIIVADGFYEWKQTAEGKQPYYIKLKSEQPMALAGLWDRWESKETGESITSSTIITTAANTVIKSVHDRMPAMLLPEAFSFWLDPANEDTEKLGELLRPVDSELFEVWPVSRRVNNPVNNDPQLLNVVSSITK